MYSIEMTLCTWKFDNFKEVKFEQVESYYYLYNSKYIICPQGSFHPYDFTNGVELKPDENFSGENWDLKCYFHGAGLEGGGGDLNSPGAGFFMLFYLMNGNKASYNTDFNNDRYNFNWEASKQNNGAIGDELYDFRLEYGTKACNLPDNSFKEYKMGGLVLEGNNLKLKSYGVKFESKFDMRAGIQIYGIGSEITLTSSKKYKYFFHQNVLVKDEQNILQYL